MSKDHVKSVVVSYDGQLKLTNCSLTSLQRRVRDNKTWGGGEGVAIMLFWILVQSTLLYGLQQEELTSSHTVQGSR